MGLFGRLNGLPAPGARLGLVAGEGDLPRLLAEEAKRRGYELVVASVERREADALRSTSARFGNFTVEDGERVLAFLKDGGVRHVFLAGGLPKIKIYGAGFRADALTRRVLSGLGAKGDDRLLRAVAAVLGANGIRVLGPSTLLAPLVTPRGVLTRRRPNETETRDIRLGFAVARGIGRFDIGQTVVVKGGTVIAVEAVEGTDETIRRVRAAGLASCVIVKTSKPGQDLRFDMPIVGPHTAQGAHGSGCSTIALEAGRTLIVERGQTVALCDRLGISLLGVSR